VEVQGLAGQREVRFADDLGLGRVRVNELGNIGGLGVPVVDQLALGDELAYPPGPDPSGLASAMTLAAPWACRMTLLPLAPSG